MAVRYIYKNQAFLDSNGDPRSGGKLNFYTTLTSSRKDTFTSDTLAAGTENLNPVTLNSSGRSPVDIFLSAADYKVVTTNSDGTDSVTDDPCHGVTTLSGVSAKDYGAVGDGVADDTAALQAWLTALGSGYFETTIVGPGLGFLPAGKYKHTATLTIPAQAKVYGVPSKSVLQASSALTTAGVIQATGSTLEGVVIDGVNAGTGKSGLSIGASGLVSNTVTRQVICARWTGTNGIGLNVKDGIIASFEDCDFQDNNDGAKIFDTGAGTPTTLTFDTCRFKSNDQRGFLMYTGQEVQLLNCIFEQNGAEGVLIDVSSGGGGSAAIQNVLLQAPYFESNQQNFASGAARHAKYHLYAKGTGVKVRDGFFQNDATEARAMQFDTAPDFVVDSCDVNNETGQISVLSGATGTFVNWPDSNGGIDTVITNAGTSNLIYDSRGTWTPTLTFATPGDLTVAYAKRIGRYERRGNRILLQAFIQTSTFTFTTASGNLSITGLPQTSKTVTDGDAIGTLSWQGITKANYTSWAPHIGSATTAAGIYGSGSGQSQVSLTAADMPTAGTVILQFEIEYEI